MTKKARKITALLGVLIFVTGAAFIGCSGEDSSITDPNGQLQESDFGTTGFSFGDDPIRSQDGGTTDDGSVLPTNVFQGHDEVDTLIITDGQIGQTK